MFDMGGGLLYESEEMGKFYDNFVESLFEPNGADSNYYFNSSSNTTTTTTSNSTSFMSSLPYLECYLTDEQPFVSLPPEIDEQCYFECCYQNLKRRKTNYYSDDLHYSMNTTAFQQCPEFFYPKTEQQIQSLPSMVYESSTTTTAKKKSSSGDSGLSAQSIAAKQRRRKISDKTQELAKLIPGSNKMNSTADMFQAAYKYVQYLQAQVSILQLMQGSKDNVVPEGLDLLLASSTIQEKLYLEEKCLVPQEFVETLSKDI